MLGGMAPRKYPLEALARAREVGVDVATRSMAEAVRTREGASSRRLAAEARKDEHDRGARAVTAAERAALEGGALRAADLALADAWGVRAAFERDALAAVVQGARAAEAKAVDVQTSAQRAVADRRADANVIEKHRGTWDAARRATAEAADEEASAEAWRPRD
jgi:hypothetical protein